MLDLNGHTINATDNSTGNFILIYNYGTLTVKGGDINLTATNNREWNAQSTIILNRGGVLTVESGNFIHNGGTDMAITVDNSGNSFGDAYLYINGGEIRAVSPYGVPSNSVSKRYFIILLASFENKRT